MANGVCTTLYLPLAHGKGLHSWLKSPALICTRTLSFNHVPYERRVNSAWYPQGAKSLVAQALLPLLSGADLASLAREAATSALRAGEWEVKDAHFEEALTRVLPSVSPKDEQAYVRLAAKLRTSRAAAGGGGEAKDGGQEGSKTASG